MSLIYPSPGVGESAWGGNLVGASLFPLDWRGVKLAGIVPVETDATPGVWGLMEDSSGGVAVREAMPYGLIA